MANILSGKEVGASIELNLISKIEMLKKSGVIPKLAIMRIGENPGDMVYENAVIKKSEKLGIEAKKFTLHASATQSEALATIKKINEDESIHGALILRPFPKKFDDNLVRNSLDYRKDLDCITDESLAGVFTGKGELYPCTAKACIEMLHYYNIDIKGKTALVIGRSLVIGKPLSMLLQMEDATVIMAHSKTPKDQLKKLSEIADIIVVATGVIDTFTKELARIGHTVLDVGMNRDDDGKLKGDVCFDTVEPCVKNISPVPGGIGSITTLVLLKQLVASAEVSKKTNKLN